MFDWNVDNAKFFLETIRRELPQALIVGCTSCGGISQGNLTECNYLVNISIFAKAQIELLAYKFEEGDEKINCDTICDEINARSDTSAVELLAAVRIIDAQKFLERINIKKEIAIFGAGFYGSKRQK